MKTGLTNRMKHGIIKYLKTGLCNNHGIEKMNKL